MDLGDKWYIPCHLGTVLVVFLDPTHILDVRVVIPFRLHPPWPVVARGSDNLPCEKQQHYRRPHDNPSV